MLEIGFENTYFQVFQGFPTLKEAVAHIQPNGQFSAFGTFFSLLTALINCKVSEKTNEGIPRKMQKTLHFWVVWAKMENFGSFWAKWAKQDFFSKKLLENFFRLYKP